ncbi:MAG: DUF4139 domain-containing protein [Rhodospirillales bacterium]|nr:DUF4139 domain-containing protein [Rhodospirillales bacterium]MBO6787918.1 DUF4139 domain-containing protein [Rhodospirillales bacterium]
MNIRAAKMTALVVSGILFAAPAMAQNAPDTALRLTIYANGLSLVDEARMLSGSEGTTVRLDNVGPNMIADSVRVELDGEVGVREIALDSDILTQRTLLERALGRTVKLVRTNPATGAETVEDAEVLSVAQGLVLKVGDRIETEPPGRIVFDTVPDDLHATPTLSLTLSKPLSAPTGARLAYLTNGLSWNAVYTAVLDPAHNNLDLSVWAKVQNNSGIDYTGALVSLVAGDVAREAMPPRGKILMRAEAAMASDSAGVNPSRSELSAFHMYKMPEPVTLKDKESRQLRLLSADGVVARRVLEFRSGAPVFGAVRGAGDAQAVRQRIMIINDVASHLGVPLPAGLVRAYVRDDEGALRFIGEDSIDNTPLSQEVALDLGDAFDVTVERTQTDFRRVGDRVTEAAFSLTVRNGGTEAATVKVVEDIPGDWEILAESLTHTRDGIAAEWQVPVPAGGAVDLTYRVRVRR